MDPLPAKDANYNHDGWNILVPVIAMFIFLIQTNLSSDTKWLVSMVFCLPLFILGHTVLLKDVYDYQLEKLEYQHRQQANGKEKAAIKYPQTFFVYTNLCIFVGRKWKEYGTCCYCHPFECCEKIAPSEGSARSERSVPGKERLQ